MPLAEPRPSSPGETLTAAEGALRRRREAEAEILLLAAEWADQHPGDVDAYGYTPRGGEQPVAIAGEGAPKVAEFCHGELGISLEMHPLAVRSLMADSLDLRHRLPSLWRMTTVDLSLPDWVARKIARTTRRLTSLQIAEVDRRLAEIAGTLPLARLFAVVEAMVLAADNATADEQRRKGLQTRFAELDREPKFGLRHIYARLADDEALTLDAAIAKVAAILAERGDSHPLDVRRSKALGVLATPALALKLLTGQDPEATDADLAAALDRLPEARVGAQTTLYLHLTESDFIRGSDGVARFEQGGPVTPAQAMEILGHSNVTIKPVIDCTQDLPADTYEFTGSLRESVLLRTPADCFPYAVNTTGRRDVDHTIPYDPDGPPDQTRPSNGGPLTRHHHRIKTHGGIRVRQPRAGLYVWRTPHGRFRVTRNTGTHTISATTGACVFSASRMEQRLATILIEATT